MAEYTVIYQWASQGYAASVPDLPGCVACGDTHGRNPAIHQGSHRVAHRRMKERRPASSRGQSAKAGLVAVDV